MADLDIPHVSFYVPMRMQDVGNVDNRNGRTVEPGLMNDCTRNWRGSDLQPLNTGEITELLVVFQGVKAMAIKRWFGLVATAQNCVPLSVLGVRRFTDPVTGKVRPKRTRTVVVPGQTNSMTRYERQRVILAACLSEGGLARTDAQGNWLPIWKKSDSRGTLKIYEEFWGFTTLGECVREVQEIIDGKRTGEEDQLPITHAWLRMRIEHTPEDWQLHIWRTYPDDGDGSEERGSEIDPAIPDTSDDTDTQNE